MKLKFGKNIRILSNNKRCIDCNEEFALMLREELCQSCSKVSIYIYTVSVKYFIYYLSAINYCINIIFTVHV